MTSRDIIQNRQLMLVYEPGVRCPACGGKNWHVGRVTAQCGACEYAMPLPEGTTASSLSFTISGRVEPGMRGVHRV